jgi:hypothetical protein
MFIPDPGLDFFPIPGSQILIQGLKKHRIPQHCIFKNPRNHYSSIRCILHALSTLQSKNSMSEIQEHFSSVH